MRCKRFSVNDEDGVVKHLYVELDEQGPTISRAEIILDAIINGINATF